MKKIIALILAVSILTMPCMAINEEWSAALGFIGGVLTTKAIENSTYQNKTFYYQQQCRPTVVYDCFPVFSQPSGHWEIIQERVWVSGKWVYQEICVNTYRKVWQNGYFKTIEKRIWVEN